MAVRGNATYTIDINAQIKGYQEELKRMQDAANKIDAGAGIRKSIENALQGATKELQKLSQNTQIKVGNDNQITQVTDKVNHLGQQIANIGTLFQQVDVGDLDFSKLNASAQELQKRITELANSIQSELSGAMQKIISDSPELTAFFNTLGGKFDVKNASPGEFLEILRERAEVLRESCNELSQTLEQLKQKYAELSEEQAKLPQTSKFSSENISSTKTQIQQMEAAIQPYMKLRELVEQKLKGSGSTQGQSIVDEFFKDLNPDTIVSRIRGLMARVQNELSAAHLSSKGVINGSQIFSALGMTDITHLKDAGTTHMMSTLSNVPDAIKQLQNFITELNKSSDASLKGIDFSKIYGALDKGDFKGAIEKLMSAANKAFTTFNQIIGDKQRALEDLSTQIAAQEGKVSETDSAATSAENDIVAAQEQMQRAYDQNDDKIQEHNNLLSQQHALEQNVVNDLHNTGRAAEENAKAYQISAQMAQQYSNELEKIRNREQLIGRVQGLIQRWFSIYSVVRMVTNAVKEVINTVKELDKTITDIAIVTNMTHQDLWNQMSNYSDLAKQYGTSISGAYKISQLYYQQGLQTNDVLGLTAETLKMARIAGMEYEDATNLMTNALRSFKMEMSEANRVTDVYAALAASSASSVEELAEAMSKTASSAQAVGSSFENTSAMMAVMIEATR